MIIGIDASRANKANRTGVEWYAFHLIQELKKLTVNDGKFVGRLRDGGGLTLATVEKVRSFIADHAPTSAGRAA